MCKKIFSLALDDMCEAAISSLAKRSGLNKSALVRRCIAYALSEAPAIERLSERETETRALIGRLRANGEPNDSEISALRTSIETMHRIAQE